MAFSYISPIRLSAGERMPEFREVGFRGDGYEIPAWRGGEGENVFLLVHGYGGTQGYWNPLAKELVKHGEVVVVATMGQTVSPKKEVGFGKGEAGEIVLVAEQLVAEGKWVHLVGVSQGGAASWIAAGTRPDLFSSVTTEAAFARLDWASEEFLSVSIPKGDVIFRPIIAIAEGKTKIKGRDVDAAEVAKRWKGPSLILMSRDDGMFTERHANALAAATGTEIRWFNGLKHAEICVERAPEVAELIMEMAHGVE